MAYTLTLTQFDADTIGFIGSRYSWSEALLGLDVGTNVLTESEAWAIVDAFDADTAGGHTYFPMLDHRSDLADTLLKFWASIV